MGKKLTPAQIKAMQALPLTVAFWARKPLSGMPRGMRVTTLDALSASGLVRASKTDAFRTIWSLTVEGKKALDAIPLSGLLAASLAVTKEKK